MHEIDMLQEALPVKQQNGCQGRLSLVECRPELVGVEC
jgi:hypothetical protein